MIQLAQNLDSVKFGDFPYGFRLAIEIWELLGRVLPCSFYSDGSSAGGPNSRVHFFMLAAAGLRAAGSSPLRLRDLSLRS